MMCSGFVTGTLTLFETKKKMMEFPHSCDTTTSPPFQMITNVTDFVTAAMQPHRAAMLYNMAVV